MDDLANAALPAVTALLGVGIGWLAARGRERRDMRRAAYLEWLRAARLYITWPIDEAEPQTTATMPHPKMHLRLVDAVAEVELVGSAQVVGAAREYLETVDAVAQREVERGSVYNEFVKAIDEGLGPQRLAVLELMRRDLRTRR